MLFLILLRKIIFKLCSHCLSNCCGNDVPPKMMLAQCFKIISNTYDLDKIQILDEKYLRALPPTLPCYSNVASMVSSLCIFPPTWDMTTKRSPFCHQGTNLLNIENDLISNAFEERAWSKGRNVKMNKENLIQNGAGKQWRESSRALHSLLYILQQEEGRFFSLSSNNPAKEKPHSKLL